MSAAEKRRGLADDIDWYVFNNGGIPRELRAIADEMEAENAKLRELVRDMWSEGMCECGSLGKCESCMYDYPSRMRELGVGDA